MKSRPIATYRSADAASSATPIRTALRTLAWLLASIALSACQPANNAESERAPKAAPTVSDSTPAVPKELDSHGFPMRYSVVPYGYNYTDFYIDSFEVNGAGGGNLEVSIPTAGGVEASAA